MASISLQHLCKTYDGADLAVDHLSLDISDGEFLVLVGPSGCGKSTALRMIAGLEDISSGDLLIAERRVNDLTPRQRNIAMVFQSYALYPSKTVYDNIAFPLRMQGGLSRAAIQEAVMRVADSLELGEYLGRLPKALSGGQRQRVAMARALVREPVAFLMDEPLSNLDAKLRVQLRSEILSLQRRTRTTTVYVTHDQVEAMTMGDRVAVLDRGVLQQVAAPQELYRH
ncbi:MAG: ABC transporter ATP-binding protein, partial [Planctomycetota bacterium]